jgi:hypothetical protein
LFVGVAIVPVAITQLVTGSGTVVNAFNIATYRAALGATTVDAFILILFLVVVIAAIGVFLVLAETGKKAASAGAGK